MKITISKEGQNYRLIGVIFYIRRRIRVIGCNVNATI